MKVILGLFMMLTSLQVFAKSVHVDTQEAKVIDVRLEKGKVSNDDTYPRTLLPITCVYIDGTVQLTLFENLGEMELLVTNQTTGEQWRTINKLVLDTSTESGVYLVEIVTQNVGNYYGMYIL